MLRKNKCITLEVSELGLRERNGALAILNEMGNLLATFRDLDGLLGAALSKILDHFDLDAGRIYLMDKGGQYLDLCVYQGIDPAGLEKLHIEEGFTGKSARTRSFIAQYVSEMEDRGRAAFLLSKGFCVVVCVPLIARDIVVGVLNLASRKTIRLDHQRIDLLTITGNQIAVAIENVRLWEEIRIKLQLVKEKQKMIKFFAYSVSHDLKSPAVALYALTKKLGERYSNYLDEKGREYCHHILSTAEHIVNLVGKINEYTEARETSLSLTRIDPKRITEAIHKEFSPILEERKIKWSEPAEIPEIVGDELSLMRVIRNLVDNAIKHGGEKIEEINIGYQHNKDYHILYVSDDGAGLEEEGKEKIFGMFEKNGVPNGRTGSGLGLAIVREIAQRHGGWAWVDTRLGEGTTFCFSISKDLKTEWE